jgi:hypothetical protein
LNVVRNRWSAGDDVYEGCHLVFKNAIAYNGVFKKLAFLIGERGRARAGREWLEWAL